MTMDRGIFIERVRVRGPFADDEHAAHAVQATLQVLRQTLRDDEASWIANALDADLGRPLRQGRYQADLSLEQMYERAARCEGVGRGVGIEHVQVVGRALAEALPPTVLTRLHASLPALRALLSPASESEPPSRPDVSRRGEPGAHTLAAGRPGGSRPVSTARPGSEHPLSAARPDRAHGHSVARSDDPHADSKLSSARGLTQEREHESLATSRRG
jgi:uncharacterized protein (DUF2267 family)